VNEARDAGQRWQRRAGLTTLDAVARPSRDPGSWSITLAQLVPLGRVRGPIILSTLAPRPSGARYRGPVLFSFLAHVSALGLVLSLGREVVVHRTDAVAVVFRRPPPPPPRPERPQELKKGRGRGVFLPRAVSPDIQPELELSFASTREVEQAGPTGAWLGGSGVGGPGNAGWADGLASGTANQRVGRDPQELNTAWECDFPEGVREGKVVVRIRVHVSASGVPTRVTVIRPGPAPFNASAVRCARRQRFRPALDVNGRPCEGDRELSILFYRMGSGATLGQGVDSSGTPTTERSQELPVKLDELPSSGSG
jgi:TonB family protein